MINTEHQNAHELSPFRDRTNIVRPGLRLGFRRMKPLRTRLTNTNVRLYN